MDIFFLIEMLGYIVVPYIFLLIWKMLGLFELVLRFFFQLE